MNKMILGIGAFAILAAILIASSIVGTNDVFAKKYGSTNAISTSINIECPAISDVQNPQNAVAGSGGSDTAGGTGGPGGAGGAGGSGTPGGPGGPGGLGGPGGAAPGGAATNSPSSQIDAATLAKCAVANIQNQADGAALISSGYD